MNSRSSSDQCINRFHCTPDSSLIAFVLSARWSASPQPAAPAPSTDPGVSLARSTALACSRSSTSSIVTCSSDAKAYSVRTEGWFFPVSIFEIELGETSSRRASSRSPTPRRKRMARSLGPRAGAASDRFLGVRSARVDEPGASRRMALGRTTRSGRGCAGAGLTSTPRLRAALHVGAAAHQAVDEGRGDHEQALEDVLPLLVEAEERRRIQDLNAET